jgi:uncharacterized membrane protein
MRTRHFSFQLEETIPGTFLVQGALGGMLAAVVYTAALCLWSEYSKLIDALVICAFLSFPTTIAGAIKSIIMWAPYRLTRLRLRAITRVVVTCIITSLLAFNAALLAGHQRQEDLAAWTLTCLLAGLPTAMLVGSRVKPWNLFTFGTLAGVRRRSVWGTLGTLPLRWMSLFALVVWCLYFACHIAAQTERLYFSLAFVAVATYLALTLYLTLRSPDKVLLGAAAVVANVPLIAIGYFGLVVHKFNPAVGDEAVYISVLCAAFVAAWVVFLAARLTMTAEVIPQEILSYSLLTRREQRDHDCLGSRFAEWQRVA